MLPQLNKIQEALVKALLEDGEMSQSLYEYEFSEDIGYLKRSCKKDRADYVIAITSNHSQKSDTYQVAMVLVHKSGNVYINEAARGKLKKLWQEEAYQNNLDSLMPALAKMIRNQNRALTSIKVARSSKAKRKSKGFGY